MSYKFYSWILKYCIKKSCFLFVSIFYLATTIQSIYGAPSIFRFKFKNNQKNTIKIEPFYCYNVTKKDCEKQAILLKPGDKSNFISYSQVYDNKKFFVQWTVIPLNKDKHAICDFILQWQASTPFSGNSEWFYSIDNIYKNTKYAYCQHSSNPPQWSPLANHNVGNHHYDNVILIW